MLHKLHTMKNTLIYFISFLFLSCSKKPLPVIPEPTLSQILVGTIWASPSGHVRFELSDKYASFPKMKWTRVPYYIYTDTLVFLYPDSVVVDYKIQVSNDTMYTRNVPDDGNVGVFLRLN